MIVKDEAHIIRETLRCIKKYIDYWVIVDTGSTDDTKQIIKDFFKECNIDGELHERPWVDFGTNRSQAMELCKGKCQYMWVIDADDVIRGDLILPDEMDKDVYLLKYGKGFTYWRSQIFKEELEWCYKGVLHEYATAEKPHGNKMKLQGNYHIESRRLGNRSNDPEKYKKDAQILVKGLEKEPNNERYMFYAGQSFFDCGDFDNAIKYYQMRIDKKGWFEETYYAMYKKALALKRQGKPWIQEMLECYQFCPDRAESLYEIVFHYRTSDKFRLGYQMGKIGLEIPFPKNHVLFMTKDVYDYKLLDETSICAFYLRKYDEAFNMCKKLLDLDLIPARIRNRVISNRNFNVKHIKDQYLKYNNTIKKKDDDPNIIFTITTCKRFDLFTKTMNSFINCCKDVHKIDKWYCIDDNSSEKDRENMKKLYPFFNFILKNEDEKGHAKSMNIIHDILTKEKPKYWIHFEDDWHFFEQRNYISDGIHVLEENDHIKQLLFNFNYGEVLDHYKLSGGFRKKTSNGVKFVEHEHYKNGTEEQKQFWARNKGTRSNVYWPHYSLRPSIIKTEILENIGKYNESAGHFEMEYSNRYDALGYKSAYFDNIYCLHIGRLTSEIGKGVNNAYSLNNTKQF